MEIKINTEFIKLGQALKLAGLVENGVEAKFAILDELVKVNDIIEIRRGKKLYDGDVVTFKGKSFVIRNEN